MNTLKFEFTQDESNLIFAALQELPFKVSAALIGKMKHQADAQLAQQAENVTTLETANG